MPRESGAGNPLIRIIAGAAIGAPQRQGVMVGDGCY